MATYVALTYTDDLDWSHPDQAATMADYSEFGRSAAEFVRGGAALFPTATATTVRVAAKGGSPVVTDGPYAETKEVLSGFFLLEADDLDAAIALAERIPAAWAGAVEVRPALPMVG